MHVVRSGLMLVVLLAPLLGLVGPARPAHAAAIAVTTTADEFDTLPATGAGCALREAIQSANLNLPVGGCAAGEATATDRITFASNTNGSAILLSAGTLSTTRTSKSSGTAPARPSSTAAALPSRSW